ncbi:MAG: K(+)-transporting ATPase subunit F [Sulfuricella sp.]
MKKLAALPALRNIAMNSFSRHSGISVNYPQFKGDLRCHLFTKSLHRFTQFLDYFDLTVNIIVIVKIHWEGPNGHYLSCSYRGLFRAIRSFCLWLRKIGEAIMTWIYILCGIVSVGLLAYLVIALLKPELF